MNVESVFDAVRRGYSELEYSSSADILSYFSSIEPDVMIGHVSNIKGILFEQEVVRLLNEQGIEATLFHAINHPVSDIAFWSGDDITAEAQLKATDSISYIQSAIEQNSDIPIIATSEVSESLGDLVINSGISNQLLSSSVSDALTDQSITSELPNEAVSEISGELLSEAIGDSILPISPVGAILSLFGFPFP